MNATRLWQAQTIFATDTSQVARYFDVLEEAQKSANFLYTSSVLVDAKEYCEVHLGGTFKGWFPFDIYGGVIYTYRANCGIIRYSTGSDDYRGGVGLSTICPRGYNGDAEGTVAICKRAACGAGKQWAQDANSGSGACVNGQDRYSAPPSKSGPSCSAPAKNPPFGNPIYAVAGNKSQLESLGLSLSESPRDSWRLFGLSQASTVVA